MGSGVDALLKGFHSVITSGSEIIKKDMNFQMKNTAFEATGADLNEKRG
jgi:hypothetical protein